MKKMCIICVRHVLFNFCTANIPVTILNTVKDIPGYILLFMYLLVLLFSYMIGDSFC